MTEYEQAEQEVAAAKVAERVAEWKAMEAKAVYYRHASEAMQASADVMGARIRRDNAQASEWADKVLATAERTAESETHTAHDREDHNPPNDTEGGGGLLETGQRETAPVQPASDQDKTPRVESPTEWLGSMTFRASPSHEPPSPEVASEGEAVQIPEGFIPWSGGECPVDSIALVCVVLRSGSLEQFHAGTFSNDDPLFDQWKWSDYRPEDDIIAYRPVQTPAEAERTEGASDCPAPQSQPSWGEEVPRGAIVSQTITPGDENYPRATTVITYESGAVYAGDYFPEASETPSELETQGSADGDREEQTTSPDSSDAQVFAHGVLKDAERKASEPKHSVIGRLFGGTKSFAKPEGAL